MSEVHYEIVNDFSSVKPNADQLLNEIKANGVDITTEVLGVRNDDIDVYINFASSILQSEKDALDIIVSNHVPVIETNRILSIIPRVSDIKNNTYRRIATFNFPGSTYATANSVSYMASGITSYDIRIIDQKNGEVLLTKTLNNEYESRQELGVLSNVSENEAVLLVFAKKNDGGGNKKIYIENINIEYVSSS